MIMKTVIVDYGSGNLHSVAKSFERAAADHKIKTNIVVSNKPEDLEKAERIVLPGVGAFKDCMNSLLAIEGLRAALQTEAITNGKPILGICVGMQIMASRGLEHETTKGLGWIAGDVVPIAPADASLKIPHMGWNNIKPFGQHALLDGILVGDDGLNAYFVHSYHMQTTLPEDVIATADYGGEITAMVGYDNIVGTQFHPEKSQDLGLALIANFLRWRP
jgi:imidazole glycerol-phosphate synthase subunit HisH